MDTHTTRDGDCAKPNSEDQSEHVSPQNLPPLDGQFLKY
jgi:hypothetical protein